MSSRSLHPEDRVKVLMAVTVGVAWLFCLRLAALQLFTDEFDAYADSNARLKETIIPERGLIYDRNGRLMVYNSPFYDLMVTPREMVGLDTALLCHCLDTTPDFFVKRMADLSNRRLNPGYSSYTPQPFMQRLTAGQLGPVYENFYRLPGFSLRERSQRVYVVPVAAHALGYVAEVGPDDIERDAYYAAGDFSGRSGVEKMYEQSLRGTKGVRYLLRDVRGRVKGSYENGILDREAVPGKALTLSLDMELQAYAEHLMQGKRGAVVAIEPETGEILAYVSAPTYDPSLLVGSNSARNYQTLLAGEDKVFLNRPIQSNYPPGSTFKPLQALILQQEGIVTEHTAVECHQGYYYAGNRMGCHNHPSPLTLSPAISTSCNAWFAHNYRRMMDDPKYGSAARALDVWNGHAATFSIGRKTGVDVAYEYAGSLPTSAYYDKIYGRRGWKGATVLSNGIGQGEVLLTPLQIANLCAIIANRGWYRTPHMVKGIEGEAIDTAYTAVHRTSVDEAFYEPVVRGMHGAMTESIGTSRRAAIPGIDICGKTGTAENPHGAEHSIFMCFAPMDTPKIAMVVFIENGGFGATWAVPMGSLLLEKYLKGSIAPNRQALEEHIAGAQLL